MDCRNFQKNLEDYLEGGLDFSARFRIERHASQCYRCGREKDVAQRLTLLARDVTKVVAPPDFEASVLARICARDSKTGFWDLRRFGAFGFEWPSWRALAAIVSALVVLGAGISLALRHFYGPEQSDRAAIEQNGMAGNQASERQRVGPGTESNPVAATALTDATQADVSFVPNDTPAPRPRGRFVRQDESAPELSISSDSDYIEYLVPGPENRHLIMRLPKTIRMRYGQPSEEHFIRNVSH